ncbi:GAF domain-containing protein [Leptospira interrogans]|uniref:GAF domain-containing protein n=1 Tax=Leptospira interrogans serovar Pomona TaxID=44276 RepID=A0AA40WB57_LEPIR|nr:MULTISPECIES: cyclic diguanylate phosphodiesterase [Leptospira]ASV07213.1 GAF domain-containing protein [Leptospira interrogans serovar Canicola]EJO77593.1 GAF domain protein [Leptospira interrogans serovar Pomona str. Kennewicki LC82-25]EKN96431.1 GAF domain protein [Leptospira interrogans serovar Pomona str. Pomona]EKO69455.1 GAF domain protein [Leptospira interrogans serovar Canicola str. Fiocruz LV133]EKR37166.1 GAF domain protein [Leptospira interrogans serovar Hebdomadis str. R499]
MGLLERVSKLVRSDSSGISTSTSSAEEKKSLLKKSEAFQRKPGFLQKALGMRKELTEEAAISVPPFENKLQASSKESVDFEESNSEELFIPELDEISLDANEQEEFSDSDLSISEDLVEKDSTFDEIDSQELSQDENDISIDDLFEDETTSSLDQEIVDSDKLSIQDQNEKETSSNDDITSLEEAPFDDWVKEAEQEARRTLPKKDPNVSASEKDGFLFDDDSNFATSPIDLQIASRKKLENYISVFEISKEIGISTDFANFFENLLFSIMGQIGSESIGIFSSKNGNQDFFRLEDYQGENFNQEWTISSEEEIYHAVHNAGSVLYAKELLKPALPAKEREIIQQSEAELLVPIRTTEEFFGIILLGKTISGEDYTIEDLEFLKIIGEIAGSVYKRIYDTELLHQENQNLKETVRANELIISLARDFSSVRSMDEAYDKLFSAFREELKVRRATFMILENKNEFRVFASNLLTPEHVGSFRLSLESSIVGIVSNIPGVFRIENFRKHPELVQKLSNDELGLMTDFIVIPLINLHWLVGMWIVHETEVPWTDSDRETAVGISEVLAPVFSNLLLVQERDSVFKDPFSPVEEKIEEMILKSTRLGNCFSLTIFKIQNISRMVKLKGSGFFVNYSEELRKAIQDNLSEVDFHYRIGQGKYAMILDGKDREETQVLIRKIKNRLVEVDRRSKDFQTSVVQHTLCYPADTKEKERILELLEES